MSAEEADPSPPSKIRPDSGWQPVLAMVLGSLRGDIAHARVAEGMPRYPLKWAAVDWGLRCASAYFSALLMFLALFVATFASDSGTPASMHIAMTILIGGVVTGGLLFFASVAPQILESWLPGRPSVKRLIVRGPCYVLALGVPIVLLIFAIIAGR